MTTLKQLLKNQECHTVTNHYLCENCTISVIKEWLLQKRQENRDNFNPEWHQGILAIQDKVFNKLLEELK